MNGASDVPSTSKTLGKNVQTQENQNFDYFGIKLNYESRSEQTNRHVEWKRVETNCPTLYERMKERRKQSKEQAKNKGDHVKALIREKDKHYLHALCLAHHTAGITRITVFDDLEFTFNFHGKTPKSTIFVGDAISLGNYSLLDSCVQGLKIFPLDCKKTDLSFDWHDLGRHLRIPPILKCVQEAAEFGRNSRPTMDVSISIPFMALLRIKSGKYNNGWTVTSKSYCSFDMPYDRQHHPHAVQKRILEAQYHNTCSENYKDDDFLKSCATYYDFMAAHSYSLEACIKEMLQISRQSNLNDMNFIVPVQLQSKRLEEGRCCGHPGLRRFAWHANVAFVLLRKRQFKHLLWFEPNKWGYMNEHIRAMADVLGIKEVMYMTGNQADQTCAKHCVSLVLSVLQGKCKPFVETGQTLAEKFPYACGYFSKDERRPYNTPVKTLNIKQNISCRQFFLWNIRNYYHFHVVFFFFFFFQCDCRHEWFGRPHTTIERKLQNEGVN